jgi:prepilin-type N-terminal cleavage/methylation domain-containing protein
MRTARRAFTLIEMLMALGVGMLVVNVAFAAFVVDQKLIRRIETISAEDSVARSMVLWSLTRPTQGTNYPAGAQCRQIGAAAMTYQGADHYYLLQVQDWSHAQGPTPPYTVCSLTVPITAH